MVSDYPEAYEGQPGMEFIEKVPTVWDETRVLAGEPGKFIVVARRKGTDWWIGGMTNWDPREVEIGLDFLGEGEFAAKIFADGADAATEATSLAITERAVKSGDRLALQLAPGGGFAIGVGPK
jgi:alpha-glucosidase